MMDAVGRRESNRLVVNALVEAEMSSVIPIVRTAGRLEDDDKEHVTMSKEKKKMNERKRVVKKGGSTSVTYKNISKKRSQIFTPPFLIRLGATVS